MINAKLKWCEKHQEPVWVYTDGSFTCVWQRHRVCDETQCVVVDQIPKSVLVPAAEPRTVAHSSFKWRCEHSVSGWCEYAEDDACNDQCLHCGQPEERK